MRPLLVKLHRWFGIGIALFLFMSGLTGAVIAWDHELDAALNPGFYHARSNGPELPPLELARRVEAADPRLRVTYLPLGVEPGHALQMRVEGRIDPATNAPYDLGFNQLSIDPATGAIQGRREWGAPSLSRLNVLPFLYQLHYTLYLPWMVGGLSTGVWLLGVVAIVWLFDSLIALVLAFPSAKSWRKSLVFRVKRGGYPLTFDLHRSGGVWVWGLLLVIATTSVSMNLPAQVMRPVVSLFSTLTPSPFYDAGKLPIPKPGSAALPRERIVELAREAGRGAQLAAAPGAIYFASALNVYAVGYFAPGGDEGESPLGNPWIYWNGATGERIASNLPGRGSAGDLFMEAQFPLHSGRIGGLAGRIAVSFMGVTVALLSVTGLVIWLKKRRARRKIGRALQLPSRFV
ncbi:PepSY domain-containing protein [Trinickia violacea]|uniref:PepSY domain-containing protein n=1 Tax=Trinickia violacea TaxID=2571746 RepID=A0A4P8IYG4_9BURK|nr:PepSY-associated TM helix domain-containing protein [Trinickia violacea]QCP53467.1 PepSY domain-containing protein [Trinickia violacea]